MYVIDVSYVLQDLHPKNDIFFRLVLDAITLALRPYSPGKVTIEVGEKGDFMSFDASSTVIIECSNFRRWPFAFELQPITLDLCCNQKIAWDIADEAYAWFMRRPVLPIDDHIILGED